MSKRVALIMSENICSGRVAKTKSCGAPTVKPFERLVDARAFGLRQLGIDNATR